MAAPKGKLKVYRTAIGFHDAWVAAPSKAAALRAWGAEKDLFAIGAAEIVAEPKGKQAAAALASPGEVIKGSRGGLAEQLAASDKQGKPTTKRPSGKPEASPEPEKPKPKPKPRPSRDRLDQAEEALAAFERDAEAAIDRIREKEEALRQERAKLERANAEQAGKLQDAADKARDQYDAAIARWRKSL